MKTEIDCGGPLHPVVKVAIPIPAGNLFDYLVPEGMRVEPGMRLVVPFGSKKRIGVAVESFVGAGSEPAPTRGALKHVESVVDEEPVIPAPLLRLIMWGARHYLAPPGEALRSVLPSLFWKPRRKRKVVLPLVSPLSGYERHRLTDAQENAVSLVWGSIKEGTAETFLLHGITGSGKTEVYLELAERLITGNRSVLFLVPEIALTPQLVSRCIGRLKTRIGSYHSGMTDRQREEVWEEAGRGSLKMVVGTRSALFLPMKDLGLIVVDEEHDGSFKQEERFRYNARDLAIVRGKFEGAVVVLGSATPSLESYARSEEGKYKYIHLPDRPGDGRMPDLNFVDLRTSDPESLLSRELACAIDNVLQKGKQAILFLNRRGFHPIKVCFDCGEGLKCPHCNVSLTLHKKEGRMLCHYCLFEKRQDSACLKCGSARVSWVGWGTERVESELAIRFPRARIGRLDRDSTRSKGALTETLEKMRHREIDILVGTQMLAKGHDYPSVTLVGVLLAESSLGFPDFRGGERTFQLITQVAGRAGRGKDPGRVIIQGYEPGHYALRYALEHNYRGFFEYEMKIRQALHYPPAQRLVRIIFRAPVQKTADEASVKGARALREWLGPIAKVLGPAPCPIEKLRKEYRFQVLIKSDRYTKVRDILEARLDACLKDNLPSKATFAVDVDPQTML